MSCFRCGNTTSLSISSILSNSVRTEACGGGGGWIPLPVPNHDRFHYLLKYLDRAQAWTRRFKERDCHEVPECLDVRLELGEG